MASMQKSAWFAFSWEEWRPARPKHCQDFLEYGEEFWVPQKTYCHLDSTENPLANIGVYINVCVCKSNFSNIRNIGIDNDHKYFSMRNSNRFPTVM